MQLSNFKLDKSIYLILHVVRFIAANAAEAYKAWGKLYMNYLVAKARADLSSFFTAQFSF